MKYEFKGTAKLLLMIYAFIGIIGLMAYVLGLTNIDVGAGLLTFIYIAAGVVLPFMTNLLMAIRYNKTMFSSQGYLTNTLPVTNKQLYDSKFITGFIWSVISTVVTFFVIFSMLKASGLWDDLILEVMDYFGVEPPIGFFIFIVVSLLITLFAFYTEAYFACTICNTSRLQGLGAAGPVLIYFCLLVVMNIVNTVTTLFVPITLYFTKTLEFHKLSFELPYKFSELISENYNPEFIPIGIGGIIINIIIYILLIVLTLKLIKRKVSIK